MEGLLLLQAAVGKEKRPLSWAVGPQGSERPARPSLRDLVEAPEAPHPAEIVGACSR